MVLTFPSVRKLSKSSSVITLLTTGIGGRAVASAILIFTCLRCLATVKFIALGTSEIGTSYMFGEFSN